MNYTNNYNFIAIFGLLVFVYVKNYIRKRLLLSNEKNKNLK